MALFPALINVRTSSVRRRWRSIGQTYMYPGILQFCWPLYRNLTLYFPGFIFFHCVNMDLHILEKIKLQLDHFRTNLNIGKMIRSSAVPVLGICYEKVCTFSPLSSFINSAHGPKWEWLYGSLPEPPLKLRKMTSKKAKWLSKSSSLARAELGSRTCDPSFIDWKIEAQESDCLDQSQAVSNRTRFQLLV